MSSLFFAYLALALVFISAGVCFRLGWEIGTWALRRFWRWRGLRLIARERAAIARRVFYDHE